jgi:hypothetical protein
MHLAWHCGVLEPDAPVSERVEVGRFDCIDSITAQMLSEVVCGYQDDVRPGLTTPVWVSIGHTCALFAGLLAVCVSSVWVETE